MANGRQVVGIETNGSSPSTQRAPQGGPSQLARRRVSSFEHTATAKSGTVEEQPTKPDICGVRVLPSKNPDSASQQLSQPSADPLRIRHDDRRLPEPRQSRPPLPTYYTAPSNYFSSKELYWLQTPLNAPDGRPNRWNCQGCGQPIQKSETSACSPACFDQFVERHQFDLVSLCIDVKEVPGKPELGKGAFAKVPLEKGRFLVHYVGLVRLGNVPVSGPNFDPSYAWELSKLSLPGGREDGSLTAYVDAKDPETANWSQRINHACDFNVKVLVTRFHRLRVILFQVNRDIAPGEQLTVDYGGIYFAGKGNSSTQECFCDAKKAPHKPKSKPAPRGGFSFLPEIDQSARPTLQERYIEMVAEEMKSKNKEAKRAYTQGASDTIMITPTPQQQSQSALSLPTKTEPQYHKPRASTRRRASDINGQPMQSPLPNAKRPAPDMLASGRTNHRLKRE